MEEEVKNTETQPVASTSKEDPELHDSNVTKKKKVTDKEKERKRN